MMKSPLKNRLRTSSSTVCFHQYDLLRVEVRLVRAKLGKKLTSYLEAMLAQVGKAIKLLITLKAEALFINGM